MVDIENGKWSGYLVGVVHCAAVDRVAVGVVGVHDESGQRAQRDDDEHTRYVE